MYGCYQAAVVNFLINMHSHQYALVYVYSYMKLIHTNTAHMHTVHLTRVNDDINFYL